MNIILFDKDEIDRNTVIMRDDRARHIVKVLRSKLGDTVKVGMIDGRVGIGVIKKIVNQQPYCVHLNVSLNAKIKDEPCIDLLLAMPRPIMLKRIFSQATELGVGSFFIVNAKRVEKSFWDSNVLEANNYRTHLLKGLEQAVDTKVPAVYFFKGFKPFMDKQLPMMKERYRHMLLAHPSCSQTVGQVLQNPAGRTLLAIGPEGGWIDYEVKKMKEAGFKGFSIGNRILRVDTAVVALHSMVSVYKKTAK